MLAVGAVQPHPAAATAAAVAVGAAAHHLGELHSRDRLEAVPRGVVLAVVAPEVAGVVEGDPQIQGGPHRQPVHERSEKLGVVDGLEAAAQLRILLQERVVRVRVGDHHPVELVALHDPDVVLRHRLEDALLAGEALRIGDAALLDPEDG